MVLFFFFLSGDILENLLGFISIPQILNHLGRLFPVVNENKGIPTSTRCQFLK